MNADNLKLGRCCACKGTQDVNHIMMHNLRAPIPGTGWGVFQGERDGAISVVCDRCLDTEAPISEICIGNPAEDQRLPIEQVTEPFQAYALAG